jgi:geranylgeranyl diphosphate synthase type II
VKAYEELNKSERNVTGELNALFSRTAKEVCEGQQYDMDFEDRKDVTIEKYLEMIRLKTAVLLGCCLQMGAVCAGAEHKESEVFYAAGENLGIAFQLTDDHLDVFGDAEKVGKQSGGDIISNKKTWLLIKALEISGQQQRSVLQSWIDKTSFDPKEKVIAVKSIFSDLKLEHMLKNEIESFYQKAFEQLRSGGSDKEKTEEFITFISTLMHRQK